MARRPTELITADWHLAPGAWKKNPDIKGDSYFALRQIVDICREGDLDLIAAGDLFDQLNPDSLSLYVARKELGRLAASSKRILYVQGQHEMAEPPYLDCISSDAIYVGRSVFDVNGKTSAGRTARCVGIDYQHPDELRRMFSCLTNSGEMLITHQVWKDFVPWRHNAPSFAEVPYDVVITGDFHRHIHQVFPGKYGPVEVISPGSTCMQALDEDPIKKVFMRYDDGTFEGVTLRCRPFHLIDIDNGDMLEANLRSDQIDRLSYHPEALHKNIQKPIVRIRYADNIPEAHLRLTDAFRGVHLFLEPVKAGGTEEFVPDKRTDAAVQSCLSRIKPVDSPAYRDITRLLDSADPAKEIKYLSEEFKMKEDGSAA